MVVRRIRSTKEEVLVGMKQANNVHEDLSRGFSYLLNSSLSTMVAQDQRGAEEFLGLVLPARLR